MKISVAICTYNGEKFIAEQIESILHQTRRVDEIILSDDGSKDQTITIAQKLLVESGVEYQIIQNNPAKGVADNFLSAMKRTTGDYCFTSDQDDIWAEDKVAVFVEQAEKTHKDLYFSDGVLVDGEGGDMGCNLWQANRIDYDLICSNPLMDTLMRRAIVTGSAMMVSRNLIDRVESIPKVVLHDEWFAIKAGLEDSAQPINCPTYYYRQHGSNAVGAHRISSKEKISSWFSALKNLTEIRKDRYDRSLAIAQAAQGTRYAADAKDGERFWYTMNELRTMGRWKQLCIATECMISGQYGRFYTGLYGYCRDMLAALVLPRMEKSDA